MITSYLRLKIIAAVTIFTLPIFANPPEDKINNINLLLGGGKFAIRDQHASVLLYQGVELLPVHINYKRNKIENLKQIDFYRSKFSTQSKTDNSSNVTHINISLTYLQNVNVIQNRKWELHIGSTWENRSVNHNYDFGSGDYNTSLFIYSSNLSAQAMLSKQVNASLILQLNISSPILAYIVRSGYIPPYPDKLTDSSNFNPTFWEIIRSGELVTINRYRSFTINFNLDKTISNNMVLGMNYKFLFARDYEHFLFENTSSNYFFYIGYKW